jgi:1-acyl-sn-glycerol-3-phosphate acyltransferase
LRFVYALLRAIAGIALRWYYSDIEVEGLERIPATRPLLLVVNHPNALVDALLVGWVVPRRVLITAKATIFANPVAGALLRSLGVVPLRRASDEQQAGRTTLDAARNTETFRAVEDALGAGGCVLIFPEGRTPDEPALAPLKTGAARMALQACSSGRAPEVALLPIGLVFERKDAPRSRVLVSIDEPILVREWLTNHADSDNVAELTREIELRLRSLTLSYPSLDEAQRSARLARVITSVLGHSPAIGVVDRGLSADTDIARRLDDVSRRLSSADPKVRARAEEIATRINAIRRTTRAKGVLLEDAWIDTASAPALGFIAREGGYLVLAGPVALWGWINHWLPLRTARVLATRNVQSSADPAMRTIIAGAAFVTIAYLAQGAAVGFVVGWLAAVLYIASLPIAAGINFELRDRLRRALARARTFLVLRGNPALREQIRSELTTLRTDIAAVYADVMRGEPTN